MDEKKGRKGSERAEIKKIASLSFGVVCSILTAVRVDGRLTSKTT